MFRRLPAGLPADPVFPADLEQLGYFIAENDEIRSISNPKAYFKFFLTKNDRHNVIQREAMNEVIRNIIIDRLQKLSLEKILLPLGAKPSEPSVPIFISRDLPIKKRVVILFYEHTQDLGVFAHRIIGGKGGINQGSAVNFVKYIQAQGTSPGGADAPGIILANLGQLRWSRLARRAVTQTSWFALPQRSAVEAPFRFDPEGNTIPGNGDTTEHVDYIFNTVVEEMCAPDVKLDIIGVSDGAVQALEFLDDFSNFERWGSKIYAFAAVGSHCRAEDIRNTDFADWLQARGRAYTQSDKPCGVFLAGPEGSRKRRIQAHGCPVFSLGEPYYVETMLPKGYKVIIDWFQEVAKDPEYANPEMRNETRDMDGNIIESDDEDEELEQKKGWKAEDYEEWHSVDGKKTGVILDEIKDDVDEPKKEPAKSGNLSDDQPHARDHEGPKHAEAEESKLAANDRTDIDSSMVSKLAGGLKDLLSNVTTTSVVALKQTVPIMASGANENTDATSSHKEAKADVQEIGEDADNAGMEDVR